MFLKNGQQIAHGFQQFQVAHFYSNNPSHLDVTLVPKSFPAVVVLHSPVKLKCLRTIKIDLALVDIRFLLLVGCGFPSVSNVAIFFDGWP